MRLPSKKAAIKTFSHRTATLWTHSSYFQCAAIAPTPLSHDRSLFLKARQGEAPAQSIPGARPDKDNMPGRDRIGCTTVAGVGHSQTQGKMA